jgi:uncharacterized protein with PIN domain
MKNKGGYRMVEEDKDFSGPLFFDVTQCPECGREITREVVENNLSDDGDFFTCPYCRKVIDIGQLE